MTTAEARSPEPRPEASPGPEPDPGALVIRRVDFGDADAALLMAEVQAEYARRYGSPDDTPMDPLVFAPPAGAFFVGYLDGVPAVSGAWRRSDAAALGEPPGAAVEVKRMYVRPAFTRRGLARRMLAHLEATAAAAGARVVVLETGAMQPEAIRLYLSSGYEPIPGFGYYADSPMSRSFAKRIAP